MKYRKTQSKKSNQEVLSFAVTQQRKDHPEQTHNRYLAKKGLGGILDVFDVLRFTEVLRCSAND